MGLSDKFGFTRSSNFIASVEIHELLQVPLVQGKFRVKWKFKGSTSSHFGGNELIDSDESLLSSGTIIVNGVGGGLGSGSRKGQPQLNSNLNPNPPHNIIRSRGVSADSHKDSTAEESSSSSRRPSRDFNYQHSKTISTTLPISTPSSPYSDLRTPNPNRTPTTSNINTFSFNHLNNTSNNTAPNSPYSNSRTGSPDIKNPFRLPDLDAGGATLNHHPFYSISRASDLPPDSPILPTPYTPRIAETKGSTNLVSLRSHTASFNKEIHCVISIPLKNIINSTNFQLQPSPLRLSIRQEVIGIHGQKEEIKTGEVILDLSQFVGQTASSRRYLLRDSKTNATLRATVKMEWIGGESKYVAPPLRSGQVKDSNSNSTNLTTTSTTTTTTSLTSSSNRSSVSLSSRKVSGLSMKDGDRIMTRTNSTASTTSIHSSKSIPVRPSTPTRSRGWHPSSSAFAAPIGLGELGGIERNAHDIIENLFTQTRYQSKAQDIVKLNKNYGTELQLQLEPTNNGIGKNRTSPLKGKEKEQEKEPGWFNNKLNLNPSPIKSHSYNNSTTPIINLPHPPSRPISMSYNSSPLPLPTTYSNSNLNPSTPISPISMPTTSRKYSTASSQYSNPSSRSVRWGDDDDNNNSKQNEKTEVEGEVESRNSTGSISVTDLNESFKNQLKV